MFLVIGEDRKYDNSKSSAYDLVMRGDINSQIHEVMEVEIIGKRKKGRVRKEGFGMIWLEKRGCVQSKEIAKAN